jgi:hypothetical protein
MVIGGDLRRADRKVGGFTNGMFRVCHSCKGKFHLAFSAAARSVLESYEIRWYRRYGTLLIPIPWIPSIH